MFNDLLGDFESKSIQKWFSQLLPLPGDYDVQFIPPFVVGQPKLTRGGLPKSRLMGV